MGVFTGRGPLPETALKVSSLPPRRERLESPHHGGMGRRVEMGGPLGFGQVTA